jgi:hypothetical protein
MKSSTIAKVGMKPPHPGAFIREEILQPHGLNVSTGADVLGASCDALRSCEREDITITGNGPADRERLRREHGHAFANAGVV